MALVPQAEHEAISCRTEEALSVAKARGVQLGNPNGAEALRRAGKGGVALRATVSANVDAHVQNLAQVVADFRPQATTSMRAIAEAPTVRGIRRQRGGMWRASNVRNPMGRLRAPS
jgi:hypothetical protein